MNSAPNKYRHFLNVSFVLAIVWLVYGACLWFDFVWDDFGLIVHNQNVQSQASWFHFFTQDFWTIGENVSDISRSFYRPLISISYGLDYRIWGLNPRGFHLTNMLVHSIVVVLVYILGLSLLRRPLPATVATLFWAIHPTRIENVCWISGRTDILCAAFLLLAFILFRMWMLNGRRNLLLPFLICLFYVFALFSKETAVMFPFVCAVASYLLGGGRTGFVHRRPFLLLLVLVAVAYFGVRQMVIGKAIGAPAYGTVWQRFISIPYVFSKYIGLLLTIVPVDVHHNERLLSTVFSWGFFAGLFVCVAFFSGLWVLFRKRRFVEFFCFTWFLAMLLPVFHLGGFGDVIYADRFLYLPSVGFFMGMAILIRDAFILIRNKSSAAYRAMSVVVILYLFVVGGYAHTTTNHWKDGVRLFYRAAETSPDSAYVYFNIGHSLMHKNAYYGAYRAYEKAIELLPGYGEAYMYIGSALNKIGKHKEALHYLKRANRMWVVPYRTYASMGDAYMGLGEYEKAAGCYHMSLIFRETTRAHNNLGLCYLEQGRLDCAEERFARALEMRPSPYSHNNLAKLALARGLPRAAMEHLENALSFDGGDISPDLREDIRLSEEKAGKMLR